MWSQGVSVRSSEYSYTSRNCPPSCVRLADYHLSSSSITISCHHRPSPTFRIQYALSSQAQWHGLNPHETVIELSPRSGEYTLREEDIIAAIEREGPSIAVVLFPSVQYYTGQWFPMERITRAAKAQVSTVNLFLSNMISFDMYLASTGQLKLNLFLLNNRVAS